jgi:hypothetical protein
MSQLPPEWNPQYQRWLQTNWSEEYQRYYMTHYVGKLPSSTNTTCETHHLTRRTMGILRLETRASKGRLGDL